MNTNQDTPNSIPHHIAIIPDGNRRWAKDRGLPTIVGHERGYNNAVKLTDKARQLGIHTLTFWAFSTENWDRESEEISYLMKIFESFMDRHLDDALKNETRLTHLGRKDRIPKKLIEKILNAQEQTKAFTRHYLNIAIDYGGRDEIVRTMKRIQNSELRIQNLTEDDISNNIDTAGQPYPNPDVIIRTSKEFRLSGFMLWQSQYSELFFPDVFFPDFSPGHLEKVVKEFSARQRRFGK